MNTPPALVRLFTKSDDYASPAVRRRCGVVSGCFGIAANVLLFAAKLIAGYLSGSIAMTSDAFNNLSDAGSSAVTLFGFRMAGKPPDDDHPFGHSRIEYLTGMIVSMAILLMGFELGRTSIAKIASPEAVVFNPVALCILLASIAVKLYMFAFNRRLGKAIGSEALKATAKDSLTDSAATFTVAIGTLISHFTGVILDGWLGAVVAVFILYSGITTLQDTMNPLIGAAPADGSIQDIRALALSDGRIVGVHDVVIHSYGPGRCMVSLHAELPADCSFIDAHAAADEAERKIAAKYGPSVVIHVDPVAHDETTIALRKQMCGILGDIDSRLSMHDFRVVGVTGVRRLVFDIDVPKGEHTDADKLIADIQAMTDERMGKGKFKVSAYIDRGYLE